MLVMAEIDVRHVDEIVGRIGCDDAAVIAILQAIQDKWRYLPKAALERVCEITDITPAALTGVSTFYSQFRHRPVGRHIISVCHGTACHVKGADQVTDALRRHLGLSGDNDTDAKGLFTLQKVACLGCCTLAPAVQIEEVTYGHLTAAGVGRMLDDFLELQKRGGLKKSADATSQLEGKDGEIRIGLGSCCISRGSGKVYEAITQTLKQCGINAALKRVGCVGMCHQTPLLEIVPAAGRAHLYAQVEADDVRGIIEKHFKADNWTRKIGNRISRTVDKVLTDRHWEGISRYSIDVRDEPVAAFLDKQKHLATEHYGNLDPTDLDEYLRQGGTKALRRCLKELSGQEVIEQMKAANLRGRGGAGFPTGLKWESVRQQQSQEKFVICNGDEGDPGAFMDRMLLESFPYRVIEGMIIAAATVGARKGYLYIRAEYPLAVRRVTEALKKCAERGLLGDDILGSGFGLQLEIMQGAGAFVCGEESALIASIEGRRGMPRLRPPYPAEQGLWKKPTLVNNVETYSLVPWILRNGAEAFAGLGTGSSTGTKVFALAGKVARGGLIEVEMGITLRQIVEEIGGGIGGGRRFKAVQVGGPSGGCVPAHLADVSVDYEALQQVGAIMGSGGLVVLDDTDCMVDIARYFLEFTQDQSCGKCTFCRVGTRRMLDILERICTGLGKKDDLEQLEQLAVMVKKGSLCQLGGTAPNPVLSTLKYFREEYEAHLEKRCPAGKCRALITYSITDDCIGCTLCARSCPTGAITMRPYEKHEIDDEKCVRCGTCKSICPVDAVKVE